MSGILLTGKTVLITGSTSGIGLGIAHQFAKAGARVMLHGIEKEGEVGPILSELKSHTKEVAYTQSDLLTESGCQNLFTKTMSAFGKIDVLVNNAGLQFTARTEVYPTDKWEAVMRLNLYAPFFMSRAVLPQLYERKWGRLIHIGSAHALVSSLNKSAYCASKHGVHGMAKSIALEAAGTGVTSNTICPGFANTPLVRKQLEKIAQDSGITVEEAKNRFLLDKHPISEFVEPENLGALAVFLCSEPAGQINGAALSMDLGWTSR